MICNSAVVTEMVSTPHDDIISNGGKRLNNVILKDEAVFTDGRSIVSCLGTDVGNTTVTLSFDLFINTLADGVHLDRTHRYKHLEILWWVGALQVFERYNR